MVAIYTRGQEEHWDGDGAEREPEDPSGVRGGRRPCRMGKREGEREVERERRQRECSDVACMVSTRDTTQGEVGTRWDPIRHLRARDERDTFRIIATANDDPRMMVAVR